MAEAPRMLLEHHLKKLKLPTFLREYEKLARQCAAEGLDHVRSGIVSAPLPDVFARALPGTRGGRADRLPLSCHGDRRRVYARAGSPRAASG